MSWSVLLSAWPMWRLPVTFGGGMTTQNGCAPGRSARPARKAPVSSQSTEARPSAAAKSNDLSIMNFWSAIPSETPLDQMAAFRAALATDAAGASATGAIKASLRSKSTRDGNGRLFPPTRDPLNFIPDQPLDHRREVVVEPLLDHRPQHVAHHAVGERGAANLKIGRQGPKGQSDRFVRLGRQQRVRAGLDRVGCGLGFNGFRPGADDRRGVCVWGAGQSGGDAMRRGGVFGIDDLRRGR